MNLCPTEEERGKKRTKAKELLIMRLFCFIQRGRPFPGIHTYLMAQHCVPRPSLAAKDSMKQNTLLSSLHRRESHQRKVLEWLLSEPYGWIQVLSGLRSYWVSSMEKKTELKIPNWGGSFHSSGHESEWT